MNLFQRKVTRQVPNKDQYGRYTDGYHEVTDYEISIPKIILACVIAFFLILIPLTCITTVPTGYTGILTTFGRVEDRTMGAGVHVIAPWQRIVKLDNRTQKVTITTEAFSSDIQEVDLTMSVNYCIDQATAQNLYKTVGKEYYSIILEPSILNNTKVAFAKYTAENLLAHRDELTKQIAEKLAEDASVYGITIVNLNIENVDFTDAFTNAVEAKQVAAQNKLTAETQQAQKIMETQAAANMKRINAEADADARKIRADADAYEIKIKADAEAEANTKINKSITQTLIDYVYANQWNGEYPVYFGGDNALIDLRPNTSN